jgi:hypothetical protein
VGPNVSIKWGQIKVANSDGNLPPLEEVQASSSIQGLTLTPLPIRQVNVTLTAIIVEDGRIFGSRPDEIRKLIDETTALYERR